MQIDPLLSLLVGALGAAALGLLGAWIQSRREHRRWVQHQRLDAYVEYLHASTVAKRLTPEDHPSEIRAASQRLDETTASVRLLGPDQVTFAALRHTGNIHELHKAVLNGIGEGLKAKADGTGSALDAKEVESLLAAPGTLGLSLLMSQETRARIADIRSSLVDSHRLVVEEARVALGIPGRRVTTLIPSQG